MPGIQAKGIDVKTITLDDIRKLLADMPKSTENEYFAIKGGQGGIEIRKLSRTIGEALFPKPWPLEVGKFPSQIRTDVV